MLAEKEFIALQPKGREVLHRLRTEGRDALSDAEKRALPVLETLQTLEREHLDACQGCYECLSLPLNAKGRRVLAATRGIAPSTLEPLQGKNLAILRALEALEREILPRHRRLCQGCDECKDIPPDADDGALRSTP